MTNYSFRYLVERDADFAIISAFEKYSKVRSLFLSGFRSLDSKLVEVKHSYMQQEVGHGYGESDIIFIMEDEQGKFAIFIEDKIKAKAQPYQRERYEIRAKNMQETHCFKDYRVFLCAPEYYLSGDSNNVKGYERKIPYKAIIDRLPNCFERSILEKASSDKNCTVTDTGVTNFWKKMREYIESYYSSELVMKGKASNKPSGSMWQEFETGIEGCSIYMKIDSRKVDLEFSQMGLRINELNSLLKRFGIEPAIRTNKGRSKSASIKKEIDEENALSFYIPFEEQLSNVDVWVAKAIELMKVVKTLKKNNINKFPI